MASMAFRVILTASLCCLSYSQSLEEILIGSVMEAVGEIKVLSQRLTEMDDRVTTKLGEMDDRVTTKLGEMDDRVTTKLGELHDRMIMMEGHMMELQASSKPDTIVQTCVQILEMERDLHRDVFNSTCRDQVAILQQSFSTEFERLDISIEGYSTKVSNFQELLTIDECATKSNDCSESASCKDALVEYTCDCLAGYQGDGFTCEDVDECNLDMSECHSQAHCNNSIGNYTCSCLQGFSGDGFSCKDVDECTAGNHRCHGHAHCNNSIGNYTCSCLPGFTGDGFHCEDVDECSSGMSECHSQAHCNNSIGNYTCSCLHGLSGDGFSCKVIPCVSPSHLIPTWGCITPVLEEMTWEDAKQNCLEQGGRLMEKISTHTEMNQLKEHFGDFLNTGPYKGYAWIGMRGRRWNEGGDLLDASSTLWASGFQPRGDTHCAYIYFSDSPAVLYDDPCSSFRFHSLCQRMNPAE